MNGPEVGEIECFVMYEANQKLRKPKRLFRALRRIGEGFVLAGEATPSAPAPAYSKSAFRTFFR